jgi:hypothetical protein
LKKPVGYVANEAIAPINGLLGLDADVSIATLAMNGAQSIVDAHLYQAREPTES